MAQELERQCGLARARIALDEIKPAARQAAAQNIIQTFDPGRRLVALCVRPIGSDWASVVPVPASSLQNIVPVFPLWILTSFLSLRWFPNVLGLNPTGLSSEEKPDETHFPGDYDTEGRGGGQEGGAPLDERRGGNGGTDPNPGAGLLKQSSRKQSSRPLCSPPDKPRGRSVLVPASSGGTRPRHPLPAGRPAGVPNRAVSAGAWQFCTRAPTSRRAGSSRPTPAGTA